MIKSIRFLLALLLVASAHQAHGQDAPITAPPIAARAYVLVDLLSNTTIVGQNPDERFEPASLTKLMTAYVVFDAMKQKKLDPKELVSVTINAYKAEGSRMFIEPKKPVSVDDLIQGMIIQSGNDASIALAEKISGTEPVFAERMNDMAKKLSLSNTQFRNATGLPHPEHYASAKDLATLAARIIRDFPEFYSIYSKKDFTYNGITQPNRNRLLFVDPSVDGMKTGHTERAGYCLIASAKRADRRLLSVVLGTASDSMRAQESQKLLNFGFQAFETKRLYQANVAAAEPEIFKGQSKIAKLGFANDVYMTLPTERFTDLKATLEYSQPLMAPLTKGQVVGKAKFARKGQAVAEVPLVVLEDAPLSGFFSRSWDTLRLLLK